MSSKIENPGPTEITAQKAYERAGKLAGVATVIGFAVAVVVVALEHAGAG